MRLIATVRHLDDFNGFNPRTHTGCDCFLASANPRIESFNPRTHTGCDLSPLDFVKSKLAFQSTHPHGVRLKHTRYIVPFILWFQSTHPHGVRLEEILKALQSLCVSIHAPTRGATVRLLITFCTSGFQSTHPHGVRPLIQRAKLRLASFNPRTHTGCD